MPVLRLTLATLLLLPVLYGQNPPIPGLPPGQNGEEEIEEGLPSPRGVTQPLEKPDPNTLVESELNFRNLDGYGIATLYQQLTGKRVLVSSTVQEAQISFVQPGGLTNREAANLLEQKLLMEGFQINPSARNPDVVSLLAVQQPGGVAGVVTPVRVIDDPALLALENGVVTYVMTFQYLKPEEAQRAFTQVYGQFRPGGTVAEVGNASSLVITEKASLIQSLIDIKEKIDVPSATVSTEWVDIRYADVQELAEQLNEIFNAQQSTEQSARVQRQQASSQNAANQNTPPIPGVTGNTPNAGTPAGGGEESPPAIIPDTRTNRILLIGRPSDIIFIQELIARWDAPSDERNFLRRKLRYLPVYEFVSVAENAIARTLGGEEGGAGGPSSARSSSNAGQQTQQQNQNTNQNNTGGGAQGFGGGGSNAAAQLPSSDRPTGPDSVIIGRTLLVTDNVTNSIVAQGPPHHLEIVERLIDELDVPSEQVAISAVFGRYSVTDGLSFGVDLARLADGNGIGFRANNGGNGGSLNIVDDSTITGFANALANSGGLSLSRVADNFGVFISALETYTRFEAFARPTVFTTNNKEARISSGSQIAIPTSTFQNNTGGGQSTNIEYRDVALELLVRPLVNSPEEITLEISINRDTIGMERDVGELIIPDLLSDQLETTVTVPVGSAVLLGGLMEEETNNNDSGIPVLRSIPILGALFKNNSDEFLRRELVIMIRPTIVDGQVQINQFQEGYDARSNLSGNARRQFDSPPYRPRVNSALEGQLPVQRPSVDRRIKTQLSQPVPTIQPVRREEEETSRHRRKTFADKHK
jgi:type II secretion system protein D